MISINDNNNNNEKYFKKEPIVSTILFNKKKATSNKIGIDKFKEIFILIKSNDMPDNITTESKRFIANYKNEKWILSIETIEIELESIKFDKIWNDKSVSIEFEIYNNKLIDNLYYLLIRKGDDGDNKLSTYQFNQDDFYGQVESLKKSSLKPNFKQLKSYCKNDKLCYLYFRLIQADYGFIQHCLHVFEAHIGVYLKSCILVPRGSFVIKTGLKDTIDLDLDLILPRELLIPEETTPEKYSKFLIELNELILGNNNNKRTATSTEGERMITMVNKNINISMNYKMVIQGISVSIDLFPKSISEDGLIGTLGHDNSNSDNHWTYSNFTQTEGIEFNQEQTASILFIKLFKKDNPNCTKYLKSYHISLALENVLLKLNHPPPSDSSKQFKKDTVLNYMIKIIEFLEIAYNLESYDINKFPIGGYEIDNFYYNDECPYVDDLKHATKDDLLNIFNSLKKLKLKIQRIQLNN